MLRFCSLRAAYAQMPCQLARAFTKSSKLVAKHVPGPLALLSRPSKADVRSLYDGGYVHLLLAAESLEDLPKPKR